MGGGKGEKKEGDVTSMMMMESIFVLEIINVILDSC